MIVTAIRITEEQKRYIETNKINLSKYVREKLQKEMEEEKEERDIRRIVEQIVYDVLKDYQLPREKEVNISYEIINSLFDL